MEKRYYGAHEALTLGIELERDGHAFYSRVARAALEFRVREVFDYLAKAEIKHLEIIEKEIEPLFSPEWYRDEDQQLMAEYLKDVEKQRIFPQPEEAERFARTDLPGAVAVGIRAEELSIEYYGRLAQATETGKGKEAFERLRKEEEKHLVTLRELKQTLGTG